MSTPSQFSAADSASRKIRMQRVPREVDRGNPSPDWSSYAQLMSGYDEAMIRGWKEEIDTLLVFAGLFSAVVTAFNIEAYKLLQDPSDITAQLLQQILQQLAP
ncbi:hypothetical protein C8Q80DRAFT_1269568 [Daedaleopsis nitida]|nr:hypothetical protein C8Q80DRAFT_1269568 [Daedaleopsis nitida]